MRTKKPSGFRVDLLLNETGGYVEYTSLKHPVTEGMARALGDHLQRGGSGGRIVAVPAGVTVESWPTANPLKTRVSRTVDEPKSHASVE